ncbi:hypothetical protein O1611_g7908 [Lasiodiplodia mahajangana]|uniref:Uncharacterized protein n=1 Tax=Lasiodiplodia mahajangana TaxID=1108764 RepID=A0ACC2JEA3_9PEZI|nr:hypothetical protein O1611_g7908 [Lasiodiplodia mahajangana]
MSAPYFGELWALWEYHWEKHASQVDFANPVIRMSDDFFDILGGAGKTFFTQKASALLNKPVDFIPDKNDSSQIYLANRADLEHFLSRELQRQQAIHNPRFNLVASVGGSQYFGSAMPPTPLYHNAYAVPQSADRGRFIEANPSATNIAFGSNWGQNATASASIPAPHNQGLQASTQSLTPSFCGFNTTNPSPALPTSSVDKSQRGNYFQYSHMGASCSTTTMGNNAPTSQPRRLIDIRTPSPSHRIQSPNAQAWAQQAYAPSSPLTEVTQDGPGSAAERSENSNSDESSTKEPPNP